MTQQGPEIIGLCAAIIASAIAGLPSGPAVSYVSYGTPSAAGTQFLLPVIVTSSDGAQAISIYRSTGAGAAFTGPTGPPLNLPASLSAGEVSPAIAGTVIWLPARGRIYQTINSGATWTTVMTAQFAYPISLISSRHRHRLRLCRRRRELVTETHSAWP